MNGYEELNQTEADLVWDKAKTAEMPDEELEQMLDELYRAIEQEPEPCDLYDRCGDCPNFGDCFDAPKTIPVEVRPTKRVAEGTTWRISGYMR